MKREEAKFTVSLASAGNPDHGQFFEGEILSPGVQKRCASIPECQRAVRDYLVEHGLGAGNWTGGEVKLNGRRIGKISYNGRFWPVEQTPAAPSSMT